MTPAELLLPSVPRLAVVSRREFRGRPIRFVADPVRPGDPPWLVLGDMLAAFGVTLDEVVERIGLDSVLRAVAPPDVVRPAFADGQLVPISPFWVGFPVARALHFPDSAWIRVAAGAWMDVHDDVVRRRAVPWGVI